MLNLTSVTDKGVNRTFLTVHSSDLDAPILTLHLPNYDTDNVSVVHNSRLKGGQMSPKLRETLPTVLSVLETALHALQSSINDLHEVSLDDFDALRRMSENPMFALMKDATQSQVWRTRGTFTAQLMNVTPPTDGSGEATVMDEKSGKLNIIKFKRYEVTPLDDGPIAVITDERGTEHVFFRQPVRQTAPAQAD